MSLSEIGKIERERCEDNFLTIHLFDFGSFWCVYEWSAYLANFFPNGLSDEDKSTPHKFSYSKEKIELIKVGIPKKAFEKFLPNTFTNEYSISTDKKHLTIDVKTLFPDVKFEDYNQLFTEWKNKYSLKEKNSSKGGNGLGCKDVGELPFLSTIDEKNISVNEILRQIISYPVENKTLIEDLQFITKLKTLAIFCSKMQ